MFTLSSKVLSINIDVILYVMVTLFSLGVECKLNAKLTSGLNTLLNMINVIKFQYNYIKYFYICNCIKAKKIKQKR